jgi:hypothetical protein
LAAMGAGIVPLLKTAVANAEDAEVKSRATMLINQLEIKERLALLLADCNNDPEKVMLKAAEMRRLKKTAEATELYQVAATLYREKAQQTEDPRAKRVAEAKAQMCDRSAKMSSTVTASAVINGQAIQINNGVGQIRIRVQNGDNDVQVIESE